MNQKKLWQRKWKNDPSELPPNNFAHRAYKIVQQGKHKTLLDLGSGKGQDALFFAKNDLSVTAVDFSDNALQLLDKMAAIKNLKIKTIQQSIDDLHFKDSSFDIIYAHLSLHYFPDKQTTKIFNQLYKMLKKDGLLFVKCKSTDDAYYGRGTELEDDMFSFRDHKRHFFSKEYLQQKLAKFSSVQVKKTSSTYKNYKSSFVEAIAKK